MATIHDPDGPDLLGIGGGDPRPALTGANGDAELRGAFYVPEPQLVNAVNVALTLNRPLLVSGDPQGYRIWPNNSSRNASYPPARSSVSVSDPLLVSRRGDNRGRGG